MSHGVLPRNTWGSPPRYCSPHPRTSACALAGARQRSRHDDYTQGTGLGQGRWGAGTTAWRGLVSCAGTFREPTAMQCLQASCARGCWPNRSRSSRRAMSTEGNTTGLAQQARLNSPLCSGGGGEVECARTAAAGARWWGSGDGGHGAGRCARSSPARAEWGMGGCKDCSFVLTIYR